MVFTALITSTATSGRTALAPLPSDEQRLENVRMRRARQLLGKRSFRRPPGVLAIEDKEEGNDALSVSTGSSDAWVRMPTSEVAEPDRCEHCWRRALFSCPFPQWGQRVCLVHSARRECGHFSCRGASPGGLGANVEGLAANLGGPGAILGRSWKFLGPT